MPETSHTSTNPINGCGICTLAIINSDTSNIASVVEVNNYSCAERYLHNARALGVGMHVKSVLFSPVTHPDQKRFY